MCHDAEPQWGYKGATGPDAWGHQPGNETCGVGREQSPIDICGASPSELSALSFSYSPGRPTMENNGRSVVTEVDSENSMTIDGDVYRLVQFHFHTPSEHTIDGAAFRAEFHLVHQDGDGDVAVVGVMVREGTANAVLDATLANYPGEVGSSVGTVEIDPALLLPEATTTFRYDGSLTTPPCSEGVDWLVMTEPIEASAAQIEALELLFGANNRPVQPIGDRSIEVG